MAIMASFASSMFSNVTKPKPLDLCVSLSFTTTTSEICPYLEKTCSSDCSLVSKLSPPTNSLPSSDAIVTGVRNRRNHTTLQSLTATCPSPTPTQVAWGTPSSASACASLGDRGPLTMRTMASTTEKHPSHCRSVVFRCSAYPYKASSSAVGFKTQIRPRLL